MWMGNFALKGQKHYCIRAFALSGRMNPTGHNTTGRCPGLCAFAPSGRYRANIKPQILGILGISITSASEKIPLICEICGWLKKFVYSVFSVFKKFSAPLRLCVENIIVFASPKQLPTKVDATPIFLPSYETDLHRVWYGLIAKEERRWNGIRV